MTKKKSKASQQELQDIADEFFPGSRILDHEAFEKAMQDLDDSDRQLLRDLRDAASEHLDMDEVLRELEQDRAKRRSPKKKPGSTSPSTAT